MTKSKLLRSCIDNSGLKLYYIAEQLGINRFTLRKKIDGETEFKASEVAILSELLNLTGEQTNEIFFGCKVDFK